MAQAPAASPAPAAVGLARLVEQRLLDAATGATGDGLRDALPGLVLEMLDTPLLSAPQEPFESDEAFFQFLVAKVALAWRRHEASIVLSKAAVEWREHKDDPHILARQRQNRSFLTEVLDELERTQLEKIAAGEARRSSGAASSSSSSSPPPASSAAASSDTAAKASLLGASSSSNGAAAPTAASSSSAVAAAAASAGAPEAKDVPAVPWLQPRFVRLLGKLDLTSKEARALEFVVVHQAAGDVLRSQTAINAPPLELVGYTGLSPKELLDFALPRRPHMSQGLLAEVSLSMNNVEHRIEDEFDIGRPSLNRAVLSAEALKALVGMRLAPSEMLKIDQNGALAHVLREESPSPSPLLGDAPASSSAPEKRAAEGAAADGAAEDGAAGAAGASGAGEGVAGGGGRAAKRAKLGAEGSTASAAKTSRPSSTIGDAMAAAAAAAAARTRSSHRGPRSDGEGAGDGEENSNDEEDDGEDVGGDDVLSSLLMVERKRDERRARKLKVDGVEDASSILAGLNGSSTSLPAIGASPEDPDGHLRGYHTDLEYLVEAVELVSQKGRLYRVKQKLDDKKAGEDGQPEEDQGMWIPWERRRGDTQRDRRRERELEGLVKQLGRKMEERMRLTHEAAAKDEHGLGWVPRLERILSSRQMGAFEKEVLILLVGAVLLPSKVQHILNPNCPGYLRKGPLPGAALVGDLLCALSPDLQAQISNRKAFYKDGSLVRDGMVHVGSNGMRGDLTSCPVEIDRRMVDFIVGLDSEVHQLVDGSHMYVPKTKMDQVVLASDVKALITSTVQNFAAFRRNKKQYGLEQTIAASGLVMLFYGDSGTGKTMTANAVAHLLDKKLLLVNFPSLGGDNAAEVVRMIFRESKINDAVLFFDECESIFESREKSRLRDVNMLLTELERHDGLIILATNRPYDLDEAMHRRITLAIEFHKPDHLLRRDIWRALLPPALPLGEDVDVAALAMRYELTGGFIKNAILSALSIATTRATKKGTSEQIQVMQEDLIAGAQLQLRGRLAMRSFERRVVPKRGLDGLICAEDLVKKVQSVVDFEKSKTVLYGQWGFGGSAAFSSDQPQIGSCVLFYGPPGTGKSLAAQAVGFEVGRPLKVVNAANVLDKYVGETGKNIEKVFSEARAMDAVLVFDEAEGLFGRRMAEASSSVDKHTNLDTGLLLHWLESYPGLCILTTNAKEAIDSAFFRRFRFIVEFPKPDRPTRAKLWRSCIPKQAPLAATDADLASLAAEFEAFSGGDIQNAVIRAASRAALRTPEDQRVIRMEDLRLAAREEGGKQADESIRRLYA